MPHQGTQRRFSLPINVRAHFVRAQLSLHIAIGITTSEALEAMGAMPVFCLVHVIQRWCMRFLLTTTVVILKMYRQNNERRKRVTNFGSRLLYYYWF